VTNQEIFKDAYNFNFMTDLTLTTSEEELEEGLTRNIEAFLKELGEDFAFLGRQVPIKIKGDTYSIDLVLYHRGIPCVIIVELKAEGLSGSAVGQVNEYVEYYRLNRQYSHEQDAIGLIICQEADKEKITYVLGGLKERIFIATYKAKLPSDEKIKKAIKKLKK